MLLMLILLPLAGGLVAWWLARAQPDLARWLALGVLGVDLLLFGAIASATLPASGLHAWLYYDSLPWIPRFGIRIDLGLDGLSLLLVMLTLLLGLAAVAASWQEIRQRQGFFYFNLLWSIAGILGVFLALDLFLFFFCWELMLIPMYFLIACWGHEQRQYAALKFFIYTQVSGLLMLLGIIALVIAYHQQSGVLSFSLFALRQVALPMQVEFWVMLGFFIAFAVKLPVFPLHTWLPDAHTQAPTAGSILLAGVLLKTGAYGFIRFMIPLFPNSLDYFAPYALPLAVTGILYTAMMAFAQSDLKRLIAYTSISHMGFILLGLYAWNLLTLQGAVIQMVAHGLSAGALFMIAGMLQHRLHTRNLDQYGGLWPEIPRLGSLMLLFALASLGLPGLGNFVGEFLLLLGSFKTYPVATALAAAGLITAAIYSLVMIQRALFGPAQPERRTADADLRELSTLAGFAVALLALGLYPQPLLELLAPSLQALQETPQLLRIAGGAG